MPKLLLALQVLVQKLPLPGGPPSLAGSEASWAHAALILSDLPSSACADTGCVVVVVEQGSYLTVSAIRLGASGGSGLVRHLCQCLTNPLLPCYT